MEYHATQSGAYLHHLAIRSPDPESLARFYGDVMDMAVSRTARGGWRCEGPRRRLIVLEGPAKQLAFAGFACRNASGLALMHARAVARGILGSAAAHTFFKRESFSVTDPDGNRICFGLAPTEERRVGIHGPIQHLTLASKDVEAFENFYCGELGFEVSDRVRGEDGTLATSFITSNHEHHTLACFKSDRVGVDHHSYEAGEWNTIRDWCDRFASRRIRLMWGPGRHGPGNNLFAFIKDPDGNWIEVSAELEVIMGRPVKEWPQEERTLNLWGNAVLRS